MRGRPPALVVAASLVWLLAVVGAVASAPQVSPEAPSGESHSLEDEEGWWGRVQAAIDETEYCFSAAPGAALDFMGLPEAWSAPNRAHDFRVTVDSKAARLRSRAEGPAWEFEFAWLALGRGDSASRFGAAPPSADGPTVTRRHAGIVERYVNAPRGLGVSFELERPPAAAGDAAARACVELGLGGEVTPRIAADLRSADLLSTSGAPVLRLEGLQVKDARGRVLPASMELARSGSERLIRLEFDDSGAAYPVVLELLAASAVWTADGEPGSIFGYAVDNAGDVNGDGYSDVLVGAFAYSNGQDQEGKVYLYLGSAAGLAAEPAWTLEGNQTGANLGRSVGPAGDVNGDGYGDIVVGAVYYDNGQIDEGRAYVYYGSSTGILATPTILESDQAGARMGICVATAGDVNGDGFSDVVVGAYLYDNGQSNEGRAFVYHGSAGGLITTPAWTGESDQVEAIFGIRVVPAGDVNGDGFSDVLISAYFYDAAAGANAGRAYVFHGSPTGLAAAPAWIGTGDQAFGEFGDRLAGGDFNGDGFSDIAVGSHEYDKGQADEGIVTLFYGSAAGIVPTPAWIGEADQASASYAGALAFADVNGDGYADLLVTATLFDAGEVDEGKIWVHLGSPAGITPSASWTAEGNQAGADFGTAIGSAGDVNGDGFHDVIVGAPGFADTGRAYLFLGSAGGLPNRDAWTAESDQAGAEMGYALRPAGDVNGDGYADVIVGAPRFDNGQVDEGRAFLFHGSTAGLSTSPSWTAESNQAGALLGLAVSGAGDVDGDGYSDVLIGAPRFDNGQVDEGRVLLYRGSAAGLSATPAWITDGGQADAHYGQALAWAGDVDGDGYSDVAIGAPHFDGGESDEGRVVVFHGSAAGLPASAAWSAEGGQPSAEFGSAVSTAGDVDGDGYSELLIGAPLFDGGQLDEGRAVVFSGSASGLAAIATWSAEGGQPGAGFGSAVSTAGDVDGDGYADVLIGAPKFDGVQTDAGRALLYRGSVLGLSRTAGWSVEGGQAGSGFGAAVAAAGDVNADGFSDVAVGAPDYDGLAVGEGRALVYHGSATGPAPSASWSVTGGQVGAAFGFSVAPAGDVDGDGFADLLVASRLHDQGQADEGRAYLFLGNGGGADRIPRQARSDGTAPIEILGRTDVSGGFRLKARGRSAAGRANVRLEWEVKPLGTPFDGAGIERGAPFDSGTPTAGGSAIDLSAAFDGLTAGPYHWRLRVAADTPYFPRSPWFSPVDNGPGETDLRVPCPATPAEVNGLRALGDEQTFEWLPVSGDVVYDVPRGLTSELPVGAGGAETCIGQGIVATSVEDAGVPQPGAAYWYLVRARSACASGSYGATSGGEARTTAVCP